MAATRRRPPGSGTLYQRSDGIWVGRVDAGWTPQGTRRRLTVSSKSKATARDKLKELVRTINAGDTPAAGSARVTVKSWADTWLPMHATHVRPTTYTTDAGALRKWIIPTIGHRRLADLTPADLRAVRVAILSAGRTTTTALHAHKVLLKMLKDASVEGHSVPERIALAPRPTKAVNDRDAIPLDQALAILRVATARPDAARWVSALLQGMRQGESLGLTWACADMDAGRLDVSWQLQRLPAGARPDRWEERHLTGPYYLTRPKTEKGRRIIPLVPWMTAALLRARTEWEANPWGLVWTDGSGQPISAASDRRAWKEIQAEAGASHPSGRPWHLHEARHSTVSMLVRAGVDRAVIESIVGHSALVASYVHVGQDQALEALEAVAARLALT